MNRTSYLLAIGAASCAIAYSGCNERDADVESGPALEARADEHAWITVDRDTLPTLERLGVGVQHVYGPDRANVPVAVRVPRQVLPRLSEAAHEEHGRCGGFMLHDDEADAVQVANTSDLVQYQAVGGGYRIDNGAAIRFDFLTRTVMNLPTWVEAMARAGLVHVPAGARGVRVQKVAIPEGHPPVPAVVLSNLACRRLGL